MSDQMVFEGTLVEVLPEQSGVSKAGKEWKTVDFILESVGTYPKQAGFNLFGDKIDLISKFGVGDMLTVKFNLESRVVNGKVYTKASAWNISGETKQNTTGGGVTYASNVKTNLPPSEMAATAQEPEADDLPF